MPAILFKLRNVPEDEADEIRALLDDNNIEYYETPAGRWGISMEAIWVQDESLLETAKQLVEKYQFERSERVRLEYQQQKRDGEVETFFQRLINRPVHSFFVFATIIVIVYIILMPFVKINSQ